MPDWAVWIICTMLGVVLILALAFVVRKAFDFFDEEFSEYTGREKWKP